MTSSNIMLFQHPVDRDLNSIDAMMWDEAEQWRDDEEMEPPFTDGWYFQIEHWLRPQGPFSDMELCQQECIIALTNWWRIPVLERQRMEIEFRNK